MQPGRLPPAVAVVPVVLEAMLTRQASRQVREGVMVALVYPIASPARLLIMVAVAVAQSMVTIIRTLPVHSVVPEVWVVAVTARL